MNQINGNLCQRISQILGEAENTINLLYVTPCMTTRNVLLHQLKEKLGEMSFLSHIICRRESQPREFQTRESQTREPVMRLPQPNQRTFTREELTQYNGLNGNPAYVAVNGVVYDVTNHPTWAAGTHFGLQAGMDLTAEFMSCHAGQNILDTLIPVGI
jgi:predicted heme/steroid binding protein